MGCVHEDYVINRLATALGLSFAKVGIEFSPQKGSVCEGWLQNYTKADPNETSSLKIPSVVRVMSLRRS